jgi:hypothetical protein
LLKIFGLDLNTAGWCCLLQAFGLLPPSNADIQNASWRRRQDDYTAYQERQDESPYPALTGEVVSQSIMEMTPLGDNTYEVRTRMIIQIR